MKQIRAELNKISKLLQSGLLEHYGLEDAPSGSKVTEKNVKSVISISGILELLGKKIKLQDVKDMFGKEAEPKDVEQAMRFFKNASKMNPKRFIKYYKDDIEKLAKKRLNAREAFVFIDKRNDLRVALA